MAPDLTGISNQNEFYTQYYLSAIFEQDIKERLQGWAAKAAEDSNQRAPYDVIGGLRQEYFTLKERISKAKSQEAILKLQTPFLQKLLGALGYSWNEDTRETEEGVCPIAAEVAQADGSPLLWVLVSSGDVGDESDPLSDNFLDSQFPHDLEDKKKLLADDLETVITRQVFSRAEPPRWILAVNNHAINLIDRSKWSEKRLLRFDIKEILERRESSTLRAMAALLHREHVAPESGSSLLDTLDENSHKHAFEVSEDLKYAAREAVELIGNEALYYLRHVRKEKVYNLEDQKLAKQISEESLRYLYRLLFVFYLEARPEKLGYLPMKNDAYRTGYSLDSLRELEMVPLTTSDAENGYFFQESIGIIFRMIAEGISPSRQGSMGFDGPLHDEFSIEQVESHLFDPKRTPLLNRVKLRNSVWQQIIQLLSLTKEGTGKNKRRGRVSYAQLGIIQLGAVYEGLLSYSGFFAETELFEVKRAKDEWNPLHQAFFVKAEDLSDYSEDERVKDPTDKTQYLKYPKGTFIYRLAGRAREKSASYYTPQSLTQCLVKYSLKELIGEKSGDENYKTADEILKLTVCEPAMGSAAFLNEAINQLADAYIRRKQKELDQYIPHDEIEGETQKIRMLLADNNVFGVDLNPVAVELAEISLWLNSIHAGNFVPWFGFQLQCGNSLIGARRQVYAPALLGKKAKKGQTWMDEPPVRVEPGAQRDSEKIYHFLLPDPAMADYGDKVIKAMAKDELAEIKDWRKDFCKPFDDRDVRLLKRLSDAIDALWAEHTAQLRRLREETTDTFPYFGHKEIEEVSTSLANKDTRHQREILSKGVAQSSAYRRLKLAMDYWCALWFWPIEKATELPSRDAYLIELMHILEGQVVDTFNIESNAQMSLFPETSPRQQSLDEIEGLGFVDVDSLCDEFPRLNLVQKIANSQRFLHWELEYADIFAERGGFDLIVGNPPWIKVEWNEKGLLSDYQPRFEVQKLSASKVAELREATIETFGLKKSYLSEYEAQSGTQNFLGSGVNYKLLQGQKTNLYKCFLPQAWTIANNEGVSGFVHPEGVYDDPKGGALRASMYNRLAKHFQFQNGMFLFPDVAHRERFSLNIYRRALEPNFQTISNVFAVSTVDESHLTTSLKPIGGIKDGENNWNTAGHPDRLIHVNEEALSLFAQLYDTFGTPHLQARLPSVHSIQVMEVLRKFAAHPRRLGDLDGQYFSTQHWNEVNAQKDRTIHRDTQFPESANQLILSGPHFYVGNPTYKSPREICTEKGHYDTIDLTHMPAEYLPRTNYVPDCQPDEYRKRTPSIPWDPTGGEKVTDYYRLVHRKMLSQSGERTMVCSISPKNCGSLITAISTSFQNQNNLLNTFATMASLPFDFFLKTMGKSDFTQGSMGLVPVLKPTDEIRLRSALLNLLTIHYKELWEGTWVSTFHSDSWTKNDIRLLPDLFNKLDINWSWDTPLRTDYSRRQALVEIDVLVARELKLTLDELCAIYRIQFPVLRQNENDTWYDQNGRIVFTCSKGLPGVGFDRKQWNEIKDMKSGTVTRTVLDTWLPGEPQERVIEYVAPFDKCDREEDYRTAWKAFDERGI